MLTMIQNVEAIKEFNHIKRKIKEKSTQKILYMWLETHQSEVRQQAGKKCLYVTAQRATLPNVKGLL